jgi:hypothetical protein
MSVAKSPILKALNVQLYALRTARDIPRQIGDKDTIQLTNISVALFTAGKDT